MDFSSWNSFLSIVYLHKYKPMCCMFTQNHAHSDHRHVGGGHQTSPPVPPWCLWWKQRSHIPQVKGWWQTDSWISGLLTPSLSNGSGCPVETTQITFIICKFVPQHIKESYMWNIALKRTLLILQKTSSQQHNPKAASTISRVLWQFIVCLFSNIKERSDLKCKSIIKVTDNKIVIVTTITISGVINILLFCRNIYLPNSSGQKYRCNRNWNVLKVGNKVRETR